MHSSLCRGELLVGIEGEGGQVAAGANPDALGIHGSEGLAGVFEHAQGGLRREPLELRHRHRVAEDVHGQQPGGALAHRRASRRRVEVERHRVDIAEDRGRPLVQQAVGRGDEAERARDHLVARGPSRARGHRDAGRPCRRRRQPRPRPPARRQSRARSAPTPGPATAAPSGEPPAPAPPRAPRGPAWRAGSARAGSRPGGTDAGSLASVFGEGSEATGGLRGWKAYSRESTRASHEASMMFSETPIDPQETCPSEESSRTRVTASVPWCASRIRTL